MLKHLTILLTITTTLLFANNQKVELLAKSVTKNGDIIEAVGDVLVYSERYLMTADRGNYDQVSGDLELFGNVSVFRGEKESTQSEHIKLNLKTDEGEYLPFFYYDQESELWMQSNSATSGPLYFTSQKAITSSCNVQDPDWKISFYKGELNRESSFVHLYSAIFQIKDIPVFYLPYFSFPTDRTRRTGLLFPTIGYGKNEGVFYEQPIYFAPYLNWDLELRPQIRTQRGEGLYGTLRFVDSPYSKGKLSFGKFNEKNKYAQKENLENDSHHGIEFEYKRSRLFSHLLDSEAEDGLWVDAIYLNDVDYLNNKTQDSEYTDRWATSKINYYLSKEQDYLGLYAKYDIDLLNKSNKATMQELPTLHYHRFSDQILLPNLLYSLDAQFHNYTRSKGVEARHYEVNLPVTFYTPLLNDYLNFSVSENFYLSHVRYEDRLLKDSRETFYRNFHQFSLYSDLAKAYSSFYHSLYFGLEYTVPSFDHGEITEKFVASDIEKESVSAKLVQFFYDSSGRKIIRHMFKQPYYIEKDMYKYGDSENSITYYVNSALTLENDFKYSHEYKQFSKVQTSASLNYWPYKATFMHTHLKEGKEDRRSYLTARFDTNFGKYYNIFGRVDYDLKERFTSEWQLGFRVSRKCWDYTLSYKETVTPKLTSAGIDTVTKKGIFLLFNLYPIGGVGYEFTHEKRPSE